MRKSLHLSVFADDDISQSLEQTLLSVRFVDENSLITAEFDYLLIKW